MKKKYQQCFKACSVAWLLLMMSFAGTAQQKTVTGTVINASSGSPLSNVSVVIKGTSQGTVTDSAGAFSITVPQESSVLVFSYAGMETQERKVSGTNTISVAFSPSSATSLNEVVVVGYGSVQRRELTSAVSTVRAKDFLQL